MHVQRALSLHDQKLPDECHHATTQHQDTDGVPAERVRERWDVLVVQGGGRPDGASDGAIERVRSAGGRGDERGGEEATRDHVEVEVVVWCEPQIDDAEPVHALRGTAQARVVEPKQPERAIPASERHLDRAGGGAVRE